MPTAGLPSIPLSWLLPRSRYEGPGGSYEPRPEDVKHNRVAAGKSCLVLACLLVAASVASRRLEPTKPEASRPTDRLDLLLQGLALVGYCTFVWIEMAVLPPPDPARSPKKRAVISIVGHAAFFTDQCLLIGLVYTIGSSLCTFEPWIVGALPAAAQPQLALEIGHIRTLTNSVGVFVGTMGIALSLLFYGLNWREKQWRQEVMGRFHPLGVPVGKLQWTAHMYTLPLSFIDLFVLKDRQLLLSLTPPFTHLSTVALIYATTFCLVWTPLLFLLNGGAWPYPFMYKLSTVKPFPVGWVAFTTAVLFFLLVLMEMIHLLLLGLPDVGPL